jgi:hypothetical protein
MIRRMAGSAVALFVAAAGTVLLGVNHAPAQCQKSGQSSTSSSTGTTSSSGTALTNTAQRQGRNGLQAGGRIALRQQVGGFQQQLGLQQQVALQQLALQQAALQNALLQQQLTSLQQGQQQTPQTQQSTLGIARQRQQPQFQRVAAADPAPAAANSAPPAPEDPEEAAARQLGIARALAADAEAASKAGKEELSTTLRLRAAERVQRILSKYADTQAADGAQALMRKIQ